MPLQSCDVIETTGAGATIYSFNNNGRGFAPCRLQIRNDGTLAIYDTNNVLWSVNAGPVRPVGTSGQILPGQNAPDVRGHPAACMLHVLFLPPAESLCAAGGPP